MSDLFRHRTPFDHINYRINSYTSTNEHLSDVRKKYDDKLIFDEFRNSIYAIDGEFGYVGLKYSNYRNNEYYSTYEFSYISRYEGGENKNSLSITESFEIKNGDNVDTKISLSLTNGEISLERLEKLKIKNISFSYTVNENIYNGVNDTQFTLLNNSNVSFGPFACSFYGDEKISKVAYKTCDRDFTYLTLASDIEYILSENSAYLFSNIQFFNTINITKQNNTYPSNENTELVLRFYGSEGTVCDYPIQLHYVFPVIIYKINYNNSDFFDTFNYIKNESNNTSLVNTYCERIYSGEISDISKINLIAPNKENEFILVCVPEDYCESNKIYSVTEFGVKNELFFVKNVDFHWQTSNKDNVTITNDGNYKFYMASGDNWDGLNISFVNSL